MDRTPLSSLCSLYIVVPCYNEEAVIAETQKRLNHLIDSMINHQQITEGHVLFVDDGSKDNTWNLIEEYHNKFKERINGIKLAGNVGHQNALIAGLTVASEHADLIVTIDADLQDDTNAIPLMVDKYHQANCDIVYGVRKDRNADSWFKRATALGFYRLMNHLGVRSVYNHADFRLMSTRAVQQLLRYRERNLYLRGIVPLIGYKSDSVFYDRTARFAGESKYPLKKMVDTPDEFVNCIVRLQESDIQKKFVLEAREMVETNYSKEVLRDNRLDIYNDILQQRASSLR